MPTDQDYKFGRLAVGASLLKQEQLEECVEILVALEQVGSKQRLWDVLERKGYMTVEAMAELRRKLERPETEISDETAEVSPPPPGLPQNYILAHLSGNGRMSLYPLPKRMITMGSGADGDIVLPEHDVTESPARLRFTAEQFVIEDTGEGGGIHVNDRPVLRQVLSPNDLIQIGSAMLLILADYEGSAPEPTGALDIHEAPVARLRILDGPRKGTSFFVSERPLVVGRHPLANVHVTDASVSDFHAHIRGTPTGCLLMDLKSDLGTRVNASRVTRHPLQIGETVSIGPATFILELLAAAKPESPAPPNIAAPQAHEEESLDFDWDVPDKVEVEPATDPMMRKDTEPVREDPQPRKQSKEFHLGQLQLTGVVGPLEGKRLRPKQRLVIIGRDPKADIMVDDASISRRHVELAISKGVAMVRDLGSRNGIFVNGKRVTRAQLQSGDALRIGKCLFIVEAVAPRPKTPEKK
jgi:pSer/pThr/pTyr-binding forkhead associated (FHA) protein